MAITVSRTGIRNWLATWGLYVGGCSDKITNGLKLVTKPVKVGSIGDVMIGRRVIGLEGTIKIEFREVDGAAKNGLVPWSSTAGTATPGSSGASLHFTPQSYHADLYDSAQQLTLHPTDRATGDTSEDMTFLKAVPISFLEEAEGTKDKVLVVEFEMFPTRTSLSTVPYVPDYGTYGV